MNKYLSKTNFYLLLLACFLSAIFAVAYSFFENNPSFTGHLDISTEIEESLSTADEDFYHAIIPHPFSSNQIFGKPNNKRNHKDHSPFGSFSPLSRISGFRELGSIHPDPEKFIHAYQKVRVHLRNCTLRN